MKPLYRGQPLVDLSVPAPGLEPLLPSEGPLAPAPRPQYHGDECSCESCCDIRASVDIYLQNKHLFELNGF